VTSKRSHNGRRGRAAALLLSVLLSGAGASAQESPPFDSSRVPALRAEDTPNDSGRRISVLFPAGPDDARGFLYTIRVREAGTAPPREWATAATFSSRTRYRSDAAEFYGFAGGGEDEHLVVVDRVGGGRLRNGVAYEFQLGMGPDGGAPVWGETIASASARGNFFNFTKVNVLVGVVLFCGIVLGCIRWARRNPGLFIRKIAGLDAVEEAIGRATEMGKSVLYLNGMTGMTDIATLASLNILGKIAARVADYDSRIRVPCRDPIVMTVAQEIVKDAYTRAGRPDAFREEDVFFITADQFSYVAAVDGIMLRERPAANFYMGYYYAESLLLAETGVVTGAIQIAGTDSVTQLPFFIVACDYTLMGEELYAASAYLSREPLQLGSLKGQDAGKLVILAALVLGAGLATAGSGLLALWFRTS
jgi:hypothetical protein